MSDMIRELGLKVYRATYTSNTYCIVPSYKDADMILVSDLRAALDKLPVVYAAQDSEGCNWSKRLLKTDTHKARLLGVEKIVKEPLKVEFELDLTEADLGVANDNLSDEQFKSLTGKKWKVVATEIQEGE